MDPKLLDRARAAKGFMPDAEGLALYEAALAAPRAGPLLEIGSYCGKSTLYLAAAALETGSVVVTIDHHRGSEEHQRGEEYHDPALFDAAVGRVDTLVEFRRTIARAGVEDVVVAIVGDSRRVAQSWRSPLGLLFLDGGHTEAAARQDFAGWAPLVAPGGLLAIHDVFPDPQQGGRPPFLIYREALDSGRFQEVRAEGSLRVLRAV